MLEIKKHCGGSDLRIVKGKSIIENKSIGEYARQKFWTSPKQIKQQSMTYVLPHKIRWGKSQNQIVVFRGMEIHIETETMVNWSILDCTVTKHNRDLL